MKPFVHVHNHTEYSLLDGANRVTDLVARAQELEQPALAITDHGVMFGAMEFYFECQKKGVKPIIGMEAYMAPNGRHKKSGREENETFHLLLLAKDLAGYRNLCKLHTVAALEGFYYKPRIDHEILREHAKGLIGTSACLGSEVCQALLRGDYEGAQRTAAIYKEIFDEGSFFIELQDHRLPEQAQIKPHLMQIAKELDLPLIATNDAHYLCRESSQMHDVLLCIGTGALVSDDRRLRFETNEFYLKSADEMAALFPDVPEALGNSLRIAEMCNLELGKLEAPMPTPRLPEGLDSMTHLAQSAEKGVRDRMGKFDERAAERLEYELGVIRKTGYSDYFLLVQEFTTYARQNGIAYGARGSAAASLVSYGLGITDVDPLEYDLTFERFLNPERVSMPDIDMDFEDERRDEVIKYVVDRFGQEQVAQIITFGTMGAKAAIKDAGRVLGYAPVETDRICKTIPNAPKVTLESALKDSPEFRQMAEMDPKVARLVEVAKGIEGMARHAGVHAAGVVISGDPLTDYIPLYKGSDGQSVTAFEMGILDKIGLLKMDFLGLSNLTVLSRAVHHIAKSRPGEPRIDWLHFPLDDAKTYELLGKGDTVGVFQLESPGMRRNIIELKPNSIRELAAMVALYRPGPMDHIPRYMDGKFGRRAISYQDERMKPILEETYGVIVYQDQVLKLVQALGGFSLGRADILRRAMSKKDLGEMKSMQAEFEAGCGERGISKKVADEVWELLLPFAGYAFNKAHAVCYAMLAYQTAYLKANYPTEYMAALLEVYREKEDRVTSFVEECRRNLIAVIPPDINRSGLSFEIETHAPKGWDGAIRFGLAAIKGVGEKLVEGILATREAEGPFAHLFEFCERVRGAGLNRLSLEALIKAGAFDGIGRNRNSLLEVADGAIAWADKIIRQREAGQDSLFGEGSGMEEEAIPEFPELPAPSRAELLNWEKETMGIYVSDHPLRGLERAIRQASNTNCGQIAELEDGTNVLLCGVIAGKREIVTKQRGERMATIVLEDFSGQTTCTVFAATFAKVHHLLTKDSVVVIKGVANLRQMRNGGDPTMEVRVEEVSTFEAPKEIELNDESASGTVVVRIGAAKRDQLIRMRELIETQPGDYRVVLEFGGAERLDPVELIHRVAYNDGLRQGLESLIGKGAVDMIPRSPTRVNGEDVPTPETESAREPVEAS
ncbi:MAG: DNA polymerase III subunit alpha [Fimbriimonadaceae bacterium]|nr:DNA polymerase III subunit alpha [Fimbriimonadaceae bacterium]